MSYSVLRPIELHRPAPPRQAPTVVTRDRTSNGTLGRTFLVFWFVVGMFGGVAVMKSAIGHSSAVKQVAKEIRALVR